MLSKDNFIEKSIFFPFFLFFFFFFFFFFFHDEIRKSVFYGFKNCKIKLKVQYCYYRHLFFVYLFFREAVNIKIYVFTLIFFLFLSIFFEVFIELNNENKRIRLNYSILLFSLFNQCFFKVFIKLTIRH